MNGFFNVYKPEGWTSFDVVAALKRPLRQKRLGHAGTLDPTATGVLPIAAGWATRLIEYLVDSDKEYVGRIVLGSSTDTYDAAGLEVATGDWRAVTRAMVEAGLATFVGEIEQTPPIYSAVKVAGEPAYRRVRRGETVELKKRQAVVHEIEVLGFEPPGVEIRVVCGKGTYVRSLAHDLGQLLGCEAHLGSLARTRVGPLSIETAVSVEQLREEGLAGFALDYLLAPDAVLRAKDAAILSSKTVEEVRQGRAVRLYPGLPAGFGRQLPLGRKCRAYSSEGAFFAVLEFAGPPALWKAEKVFPAS
ncbi:MAG: tRNA pseudouridine(55) synthase TruB [Dehalococcoidia bacterium]